ncbi:MAG: GldG family protein [Bacteriovoracaceae bacterium]|jgi:ABC-type uncharacterized transport system involved in gliding motility auxiliary subunit|nr:GldG family protein [Bacteriovoracaceae bacterium]
MLLISSLVLMLSSILLIIVAPEFSDFNFSLLVIGFLLFLFYVIKTKTNKKIVALKELITIFLTLCIVGIISFIGLKLNYSLDITHTKIHTLSDKSKKIVSNINQQMSFKVFSKRQFWGRYRTLLSMYSRYNTNIKLDFIDPSSDIQSASAYKIEKDGTVIIEYKGRLEYVTTVSELNITNKILKFISQKDITLCYLSTHGEFSFKDSNKWGMSFLKQKILDQGYKLEAIDLLKDAYVNPKCSSVLILGPKNDITQIEKMKLINYLDKAGNLLLTIGPSFSQVKRNNLRELLTYMGLEFKNAVLVDRLSSMKGQDASIIIADKFKMNHPITKSFSDRVLFPISSYIEVKVNDAISLFDSAAFPAGWAETDLKGFRKGQAAFDKKDIKKKGNIVVAIDSSTKYYRSVVFTSEQFILNNYQGLSSHFNLFLNSIDWLVGNESLISLNRPGLTSETIDLNRASLNVLFYFYILILPFIFFTIAYIVFIKRKNL